MAGANSKPANNKTSGAKGEAPLIVKKGKKGHHGGHHGGAWKVAYADFVTAMMAFFLLLWLLNATTEDQKRGIADYFSVVPAHMRNVSGGENFFGGKTVAVDGPLVNQGAPLVVAVPEPSLRLEGTEGESETAEAALAPLEVEPSMDTETARKVLADIEENQFREAETQLRQAIQEADDLRDLAQNLLIERTPEGLRIQVVDREKYAMFPRGSSKMDEKARRLLHKVAEVIRKMPQKIAITGHTDATPYVNAGGYDNWDLSTDRANASRRAMVEAGLSPSRIATMTGRADKEPLVAGDPLSPLNRRISIVLLREQRTTPAPHL